MHSRKCCCTYILKLCVCRVSFPPPPDVLHTHISTYLWFVKTGPRYASPAAAADRCLRLAFDDTLTHVNLFCPFFFSAPPRPIIPGRGMVLSLACQRDMLKVCVPMWHEKTLASIRAVFNGQDVPSTGYDSDDDPRVLLGKRVQARKNKKKRVAVKEKALSIWFCLSFVRFQSFIICPT